MFGDYFKIIKGKKLNVAAMRSISTIGEPYLEQYTKVEERRVNRTQRRRQVNSSPRFDLSCLDDN
jgi:hypothetical protein